MWGLQTMMMRGRGVGLVLAAVLLSGVAGGALAQNAGPQNAAPAAGPMVYQQPPQPIADILDAKPTPSSMLSPDRRTLVLMDRSNLPSIKALAARALWIRVLRCMDVSLVCSRRKQ